jgi:hypothetical protein
MHNDQLEQRVTTSQLTITHVQYGTRAGATPASSNEEAKWLPIISVVSERHPVAPGRGITWP